MKHTAERLHDHVVLCGYGATGRAAVQELLLQGAPAEQIVVIANSEPSLRDAVEFGVVAVMGDATHESVLQSVAIERAAHVLILPGRDDTAVLIALTVRDLNPQVHLVAMCHEAENVKLLVRAGVQTVITPSVAGGNLMAASTRREHLVETLQDFLSVSGAMRLDERPARRDEAGKAPQDLDGISLVRVYRGEGHFDAPNLPVIEQGDILVYIASGQARAVHGA